MCHVISTHTSQQAEHAEAVAAVRAGLKPRGAVRRTRLWSVQNQTVAPRRWRAARGETETGGGDDRSEALAWPTFQKAPNRWTTR